MQTAGNLIPFPTEFTSCMKFGENDFDSRNLFLRMLIHRNAAPVVDNGHGIIFMDGHVDFAAEPCKSLVDRIIDDLVDEMMKPARAG